MSGIQNLYDNAYLTLSGMGSKSNQGATFIRLNEVDNKSKYTYWSQFSPPKKFENFWKNKSADKIWSNKHIKVSCQTGLINLWKSFVWV